MKRSSTKINLSFALVFLIAAGCATKPVEKTVDFQMRWVRAANEKFNWTFHRAEQGTPYIDGSSIISGNGVDGIGLWTRDSAIRQWFLPVTEGVYSGIVAVKNRVYFGGSDGQFYCVDRVTGKVIWTFPTRSENLAAPLVEEGVVYFLAGNNVLYAVDAISGKLLWNYRREEVNNLSVRGGARPTKLGDHLYAGFSDGYLVSLNPVDGSLQWERKLSTNLKFVDIDGTPVVDGNSVYAASYDGSLYALSTNDGQIQWRVEEGGATAVTVDKDHLYFGSTNQVVLCLKKETGEVLWKYAMEEGGVPTQPVVQNGVVFVGSSESDLIALDANTGKKAGAFRPGYGIFSAPFVDPSKKEVIFLSNGSNIFSLDYHIGTNTGKASVR